MQTSESSVSSFNLVVQGQEIATQQLKQLAKLTGAGQIQSCVMAGISHQAFILHGANPDERQAVQALANEWALDWAYMPAGLVLEDVGLIVMDMDSTLITIECIDEIADLYGLKPQVAAITEKSMRGELDFAQSLRERVALLAGLEESALERVYSERLHLSPGAEVLLARAHAAGAASLLVSGGFTFFTERLKARLGLSFAVANTLEVADGRLTGRLTGPLIDAQAKADHLLALQDRLRLQREQIVALGDGANDLKMLAAAGYGIAYHAKPVVQAQATLALNHVGLDGVLALFAAA